MYRPSESAAPSAHSLASRPSCTATTSVLTAFFMPHRCLAAYTVDVYPYNNLTKFGRVSKHMNEIRPPSGYRVEQATPPHGFGSALPDAQPTIARPRIRMRRALTELLGRRRGRRGRRKRGEALAMLLRDAKAMAVVRRRD